MSWSTILVGGVVVAGVWLAVSKSHAEAPYDGPAKSSGPQGESLATVVTDLRKQKKLVGLAAMVTVDDEVVANAAVGERMIGSGVPLDLGDRWHLGSITKSITATMIARLIEGGRMQWTDTVGARIPDVKIHEEWKAVTLEQLLTHTSGAAANFGVAVRLKQPPIGPERVRERRQAVLDVMQVKPAVTPGKSFAYSNVGYTIAAAMAEAATGDSWEDLVQREVFEPLELKEAGFGPPKSPLKTFPQPRGHSSSLFGKSGVSDTVDNTPIMGPAGIVHMTLADLSRFTGEHLRGERGESKFLTAATFQRLHTPRLSDYACGWVKKEPTQAIPRTVYWHNGSNTMWYALEVFIPEKRMVVVVAANDGDIGRAESAAWKVVEWASGEFKTEGDEDVRKSLPGR